MKKSLGLIEICGLATAVVAADAAVKSANVKIIGYEFSKGSGMTLIKLEGDVGSVKAAIDAAESVALRAGAILSKKVIPRPADNLEIMIKNKDTKGYQMPQIESIITEEVKVEETIMQEVKLEETTKEIVTEVVIQEPKKITNKPINNKPNKNKK